MCSFSICCCFTYKFLTSLGRFHSFALLATIFFFAIDMDLIAFYFGPSSGAICYVLLRFASFIYPMSTIISNTIAWFLLAYNTLTSYLFSIRWSSNDWSKRLGFCLQLSANRSCIVPIRCFSCSQSMFVDSWPASRLGFGCFVPVNRFVENKHVKKPLPYAALV